MKLRKWLEKWNMTSLKIKASFLEGEWNPSEPDKDAAWDLYIELLTRVTTQRLRPEHGTEQATLDSVYALFNITRQIIKTHGRGCMAFTKIAIVVLNQVVRPFTAKWHRISTNEAFRDPDKCVEFRKEFYKVQLELKKYTKALADMADVEDITSFEDEFNE